MDKIAITLLLTSTVLLTQATPIVTRKSMLKTEKLQFECSQLLFLNGMYAFREKIASLNGIPADIRVHWKARDIYFTLVSNEMKMSLQVLRISGEIETIKVAGLGQSTTVDNLNDIVYLATDNGVYKLKNDGSIELHTALGEDIMYIAVNSDGTVMYIATWPQNRVYKINNETQNSERFAPITNGHGLTIDTRNNIYFVDVATETLYVLKNGDSIPTKIKGLSNDKMINVFVSRSDNVYAMDDNSNIFQIDADNEAARYLRNYNITGVNTFGMDEDDNVVVGVRGAMYKYYLYKKNPCNMIAQTHPRFPYYTAAALARRRRQRKTKTTTTTEFYEEDEEDEEDSEE